jgi:phosphonate ABC transporter substrate-binding protein
LVFDRLVQASPALRNGVRVIHRSPEFGVSPVVASTLVAPERREAIRKVLLALDRDPEAAEALRGTGIERSRSRQERRLPGAWLDGVRGVLQRVPPALPLRVTAQERPDARRDPQPSKLERQTGARRFVGSGAVEDHVAIARDLLEPG